MCCAGIQDVAGTVHGQDMLGHERAGGQQRMPFLMTRVCCVSQKMMIEQEVKVTPTFLLYRDHAVVHRLSGINEQNLRTAIEEN